MTPIMDHCFGVGKTSLVYNFRSILASSSDLRVTTFKPLAYSRLFRAVYLNIRFDCMSWKASPFSYVAYEKTVFCEISRALSFSLAREDLQLTSTDELLALLRSLPDVVFLFHFDNVGAYEVLDPRLGAGVLCALWLVAEQLREYGHFCVLTGRSAMLRLLGKVIMPFNHSPHGYRSPSSVYLVPLGLLSQDAIRTMFLDHPLHALTTFIEQHGNLQAVHAFTGGVPRAVALLIQYLGITDAVDLTAVNSRGCLDLPTIHSSISDLCCASVLSESDAAWYRVLLEIAWAEIDCDLDSIVFGEEFMSSFVARVGIYTTPCPHLRRGLRILVVVPLFQLRAQAQAQAQSWFPHSLLSIGEYDHAGARLEKGFRRILHLRMALGADSWTAVGLGSLDRLSVPYPSSPMHRSYPFPNCKISSVAIADIDAAADPNFVAINVMDRVHSGQEDVSRQVYSPSQLSALCEHMLIGQFYQPLPMSQSAEVLILCRERAVCQFQFKHILHPLTESQLRHEAVKCQLAPGWQSFLVVAASAGHAIGDRTTQLVTFELDDGRVDVLALSETDVISFLGARAVAALQPPASLLADSMKRLSLSISSPIKQASSLRLAAAATAAATATTDIDTLAGSDPDA